MPKLSRIPTEKWETLNTRKTNKYSIRKPSGNLGGDNGFRDINILVIREVSA
jgi:hypothetical protein